MLDRFKNYKLTPANYVPNNIHYNDRIEKPARPPLVMYSPVEKDEKGNPKEIGFTWTYGDSIYLEFRMEGDVIYDNGDYGQEFGHTESIGDYLQSRTLARYKLFNDDSLEALGDPNIVSKADGTYEETASEENDGEDDNSIKFFQILIYNFRYEVVAWCEVPVTEADYYLNDGGNNSCKFKVLVDSFYPQALVKGTYTLELNLIDENANSRHTLINKSDCKLFIT